MRPVFWCGIVFASGCGLSVVGSDPVEVDAAVGPTTTGSVPDASAAITDSSSVTTDDHELPSGDVLPVDASNDGPIVVEPPPTICNGSACKTKCCVEKGSLACESTCKDWEIGCTTSKECGTDQVCCFDAQRRSRCADSCNTQRVCDIHDNDCPPSYSCIQATCYDAPAPFGTCQKNGQSGLVMTNNCRFRG